MGVQKITFDGSSVTSKHDADLNDFIFAVGTGVLQGSRGSVFYTLANNTITFEDGYVMVQGRLIYIENNTQVVVTPNANRLGYVVLNVDLTSNEVSIYVKEQASTYPNLVQNDLSSGQGQYEFALCAYSKTTTSVTLNNMFNRQTLLNADSLVYNLEQKIRNQTSPIIINPTYISQGVYRISNYYSNDLIRAFIMIILSNGTVVNLPGPLIFEIIGSSTSVAYTYNGITYSMFVSYQNGYTTFTCGSTTHTINRVIIYRF
ncbi:MAG TPA: hypothetical protein DHV05_03410 [Acholeplasmataceae bacterium]|nr:hypothetical protein [Acholeplasmataceae bacterium]